MADVGRMPDPDKRAARAAALRREVLDRLIDEELILQQAADLKLSISSEQVDSSIEEIKKQNNIDDDQLREALKGQGMSMAHYRADIKRQLLRFRVLNIAVGSRVNISDEEIKAYYERHMKGSANTQVRASHIFIAIPEGADRAAAAEKQAQAQKVLERARAGEDFAKLAREVSDDAATRAEGGDLGFFGKDMLPKPIEELVFSMQPGEIRGPVRADRGFHVIKMVDRKVKDAQAARRRQGRHPHAAPPERHGAPDQELPARAPQEDPGRHQVLDLRRLAGGLATRPGAPAGTRPRTARPRRGRSTGQSSVRDKAAPSETPRCR